MSHRTPAVIAAELDATIESLPTAFLPSGVRDALTLTREFCASVAALIEQARPADTTATDTTPAP